MTEVIEICITVAPLALAVAGAVTSAIVGKSKKKSNKNLTVEQQKNDLRSYMIKRCEVNELFAPVLKSGLKDKTTISEYKKNIVLNDCKIYAKACGYEWYNEEATENMLVEYIHSANIVAGKTTV